MDYEDIFRFAGECIRSESERAHWVGIYDKVRVVGPGRDAIRDALVGIMGETVCRSDGSVYETLLRLRDDRKAAGDEAGAAAINGAIDVLFPVEG